MKKYIYISMAALFLGTGLTGCSDFLEAENKTSGGQEAGDYLSSNAESFLVTTYSSLKDIVAQVGINDQGTDLFFNTRGHAGGVYNEYTLTPEEKNVQEYYSNTYKTINYANGVLQYAGNAKTKEEARFIRDYGYYLLTQQFGAVPYITEYINNANRDYPRTDLETIYTGLIGDLEDLYNNSSLDAQSHEGHASKQAVAALLAKVCLAAGWDLKTTLTDAEKGTYTIEDKDYFELASSWAEKAIAGVQLTMPFAQKWAPANEGNAEEIWSVQYDRASYPGDVASGGHSLQNTYGGYYGNVNDYGLKYTDSDNQPRAKAVTLFEKGDLRYEGTFMTTYYNSTKDGSVAKWGTDGYFAYYNVSAADLANHPIALRYYPYYMTEAEVRADLEAHKSQFAAYANRTKVPQAVRLDGGSDVLVFDFKEDGSINKMTQKSYTEYMEVTDAFGSVKKFDDPESGQLTKNNDYRDIVIFHVSDMYLVAAEAYYMAGDKGKALNYLNAVRTRAGLAALAAFSDYDPQYSTSSGFEINDLDLILDERARECYAERTRWTDLRRTKQLVRYNVEFNLYLNHNAAAMQNNKGEYKWLRPIPQSEISSNTGITDDDQNPGY